MKTYKVNVYDFSFSLYHPAEIMEYDGDSMRFAYRLAMERVREGLRSKNAHTIVVYFGCAGELWLVSTDIQTPHRIV